MNRPITWSASLATLTGLALASSLPADDALDGQQIYTIKGCYQCHGLEGQGALLTGPRIGPNPLPLANFRAILRRPPDEMPAYSPTVLSDAEIEAIHRFLQSRAEPAEQSLDHYFSEP
jgi:mono/diheme cytochrome c family protein